MKKIKIISIIAIFLLAINIFWILFFISHKPLHGRGNDPKKVIIEKLHLDELQTKEYEKLIDGHRESIRNSEKHIMELKNQLYKTLKERANVSMTDSLMTEIGKAQIEIEHINYNHFQDIKQLCKPEQLNYFNELCNDIAKLFGRPSPPENEKH